MHRHMSKHLSKFIKTLSCLTTWNVTSYQTFNLSWPNIQSCCFVCWGRGAFFLFFFCLSWFLCFISINFFRIWQIPKFRLFFTVTTVKSELEGSIKSRSFFPLDILEFDNKGISGDRVLYWMPLIGILTRLPTSIFEKFHYQTFFLQLRNHSTDFSDIGHWSNLNTLLFHP